MTTTLAPAPVSRRHRTLYWVCTGLLSAVFAVSGLLHVFDPNGTVKSYLMYGYPGRLSLVYAIGLAKLAAVAVILLGRWPLLRTFAMAGLLFDLLLALEAHAHVRDTFGLVAVATVLLWIGAFTAEQRGWRAPGPPETITR